MYPVKCIVWCGVTPNEIIGPYFFEDKNGNQTTVTGARYRSMLLNFLEPWVQAKREQMWFQQDGATANTAREDHSNAPKHFSRSNHFKGLQNKLANSITIPDKSRFLPVGLP